MEKNSTPFNFSEQIQLLINEYFFLIIISYSFVREKLFIELSISHSYWIFFGNITFSMEKTWKN